ncbi:MAG TPA: sodium ion-translocating decarboxylase subunit beta [Clostridiaceae bacterium]|nr:sodium ion-translocating decarboxylase subunit beta [Clostridiaceae bacterium]
MEALQSLIAGFTNFTWKHGIMLAIGILLIYLAIKKEYEPVLLLPMGVGCILANIPLSSSVIEGGWLNVLYNAGIANELFPVLIFIGIGAMIDFSPLFKRPVMLLFGAAAQMGIFVAMLLANATGMFTLRESVAIGIIGAADGPTSIYVAGLFAQKYLGPITVAAYSYMALVPIIQPPVIKLLTSRQERLIRMDADYDLTVKKSIKISFPIIVTIVAGFIAPSSTPLIGSLMFGNLLRESLVVNSLSETAQKELANIVTLLMGVTIGSTMVAERFVALETILILFIGLLAFVFDTVGGVLLAKIINIFLKEKLNPMIGACGISAFPMSARVIQKMAVKEDPTNFILMPAISANVSGQIGSIIAGSVLIAMLL